ncbi:MAG: hypothetical protein JNL79_09575 [Myxococcales bacterium]|nr:hypothetical protein [Myxococcales bacterium]
MLAPTETLRTSLVPAEDLPRWVALFAIGITVVSVLLLLVELRRARDLKAGVRVFGFGILAAIALFCAVVRPHRLRAREATMTPRVVVLLDRSRSMVLPSTASADGTPRIDVAESAVAALRARIPRVEVLSLGVMGGLRDVNPTGTVLARADGGSSAAATALRALLEKTEDPPTSIVLVSDGAIEVGDLFTRKLGPVVHTVSVADTSPPDVAIRAVKLAGAAVAHQALPLQVEIACTGGITCGDLPITVRELREGAGEAILATGTATPKDGVATIELQFTLEQAGTHAIEVFLTPPKGDLLPQNDRRTLTVEVARERVRVLHVAGRPTYDVRALRQWLKSDAAIDVVSFFILRTPGDDVNARDDELALIPFPVDELFTEHLKTFDAVILQDFDAEPYALKPHLPKIAKYVEDGGGLVHVGGPNAFAAGGYGGSPLQKVTPVDIPTVEAGGTGADLAPFVPQKTKAARRAPILAELDRLLGDELPEMPGANILGDVRGRGVALWVHPTRTTKTGKPMPVLSIADVKNGRSIALGLDGTRVLGFSKAALASGGRAYDAFFRGLLGWLMRDPRYEPVRARVVHATGEGPCLTGAPAALRVEAFPVEGKALLRATLTPLPGATATDGFLTKVEQVVDGDPPVLLPLGTAGMGGFAVRVSAGPAGVDDDDAPALATRTLAACEPGGDELADPRPDPKRLAQLAAAQGGVAVSASDVGKIPAPAAAVISVERSVSPILPAWAWSGLAALLASLSWYTRRRGGLP